MEKNAAVRQMQFESPDASIGKCKISRDEAQSRRLSFQTLGQVKPSTLDFVHNKTLPKQSKKVTTPGRHVPQPEPCRVVIQNASTRSSYIRESFSNEKVMRTTPGKCPNRGYSQESRVQKYGENPDCSQWFGQRRQRHGETDKLPTVSPCKNE